MPRDLETGRGQTEMPSWSDLGQSEDMAATSEDEISRLQADDYASVKDLHSYAQILGLQDVESCLKLEEAAFPPNQRCSREKFRYRLSACSELCLGLFSPAGPHSSTGRAATAATAKANDSTSPDRKGVLLAHIIATKTHNRVIHDNDMQVPDGASSNDSGPAKGHQEDGRTIGVHSLAVLPDYQRRGLGKILMKSYIQRMIEAENADRISLLTYDRLVDYYERFFGFKNLGKSNATFGGEIWNDMTLEFVDSRLRSDLFDEDEDDGGQ